MLSRLCVDCNGNLKYDIVSLVLVAIFYSSFVYLIVLCLCLSFVTGDCILGLFCKFLYFYDIILFYFY
jgi:hypothetical protein